MRSDLRDFHLFHGLRTAVLHFCVVAFVVGVSSDTLASSGPSPEKPRVFKYRSLSANGTGFIVKLNADATARAMVDGSDLLEPIKACGREHQFRCVIFSSLRIAIPKSANLPDDWRFENVVYRIAHRPLSQSSGLYVITATFQDSANIEYEFIFSPQFGLLGYSKAQRGDASKNATLTATYLLMGTEGILASE